MNKRRICVTVMACFVLMVSGCQKESNGADDVKVDEIESVSHESSTQENASDSAEIQTNDDMSESEEIESVPYESSIQENVSDSTEIQKNDDMSESEEMEDISYLELTKQHLNMTVEEIEKKYNVEIEPLNGSMTLVYGSPAVYPVLDIWEYEMFVLCIGEDISMNPGYITYTEEKMNILYEELNIAADFNDEQLKQGLSEKGFERTDTYQDNDQYVFIYESNDLTITVVSFNEDATEYDMYFSK